MNDKPITTILPGKTIGIIGGGQLGKMIALAGKAMGFRIAVLDPNRDSPCSQVADFVFTGEYDNRDLIEQLARKSDVLTFEFENIEAEALNWVSQDTYIPQGTELLKITKDRISEKQMIEKAGIKVAPYEVINTPEELQLAAKRLRLPAVLKTARGGYDGKGQLIIQSEDEIGLAGPLLEGGSCVLEKWLDFEKEISVIVSRSKAGSSAVFPVAENVHVDNILHQTIVPARISHAAAKRAEIIALELAEALEMVGTLAVEMFLMEDDLILVNELAPRPHNSGHYTIEACETSQFEQHIRAICNWPLGSTRLLKSAVMVNILGEHQAGLLEQIPKMDNWKIHIYGKDNPKLGRKMGHVSLLRDTVEEALNEVRTIGVWDLEKSTNMKLKQ